MIHIPKLKLKTFLILLPFLLSVPTLLVLALETFTTSNQQFCLTCHYQMWGKDFLVESKVHPDEVKCPECHAQEHYPIIPPKDFSAHPERVNENCMRCHSTMTEKGDNQGFIYNVMKIKFPHDMHIQDIGAICTDCHYNVKHDKHVPQTNRPRMEACFACHDQKTTSCLKCHPKGEHLLLSLLPKHETVKKETCDRCHEGFEERVQEKYDIRFKHPGHIAAGVDCNVCHENKNRHGTIIKQRNDCLGCHHNEVKRDCTYCHKAQVAMRMGKSVPGIQGSPDKMAELVDCSICHAGIADGHSIDAVKETCTGCHDGQEVYQVLEDIQSEITAGLEDASMRYDKLEDKSSAEAKAVAELIDILKREGSRGFHNPPYAREILKRLDQKIVVLTTPSP